jgi:hypothetical protein
MPERVQIRHSEGYSPRQRADEIHPWPSGVLAAGAPRIQAACALMRRRHRQIPPSRAARLHRQLSCFTDAEWRQVDVLDLARQRTRLTKVTSRTRRSVQLRLHDSPSISTLPRSKRECCDVAGDAGHQSIPDHDEKDDRDAEDCYIGRSVYLAGAAIAASGHSHAAPRTPLVAP